MKILSINERIPASDVWLLVQEADRGSIHAGTPEPDTEIPRAQTAHYNFWDFQYIHFEATHMSM